MARAWDVLNITAGGYCEPIARRTSGSTNDPAAMSWIGGDEGAANDGRRGEVRPDFRAGK